MALSEWAMLYDIELDTGSDEGDLADSDGGDASEAPDLPTSWTPLLLAVESADAAQVRSLLADGADPDRAVEVGTAPPHGFDTEMDTWVGYRPLAFAAWCGRCDVVEALLDGRASVDLGHAADGATAAYTAAGEGHCAVLQLLADHDADLDAADDVGMTAAHIAAECGCVEVLQCLCDNKARIHEPARIDGESPLHLAAFFGHIDTVYYLLRCGAGISRVTTAGDSALSHARAEGHQAVAGLLEAVERAGDWREYVARQRMPYCLIRHEVSKRGLLCPPDEDEVGEQGLNHFVFGGQDEVVANGWKCAEQGATRSEKKRNRPSVLRTAPDDVFAVIMSLLIG